MIEIPNSATVSYLMKFKIAAIYVLVAPGRDNPCVVGMATDIGRSAGAIARKHASLFVAAPPDIAWAAWCDIGSAWRIFEAVTHGRGGLVQSDLPSVVAAIEAVALRYPVGLCKHEVVLQRASVSADRIATKITASNGNGALSFFNAAYRERRLAAARDGQRIIPCGVALTRLNRAMADAAAAKATTGVAAHAGLLRAVFGE